MAREITPDPTLSGFALAGEAIKLTISRLGDGDYAQALQTVFRISDDVKAIPKLEDRGDLAASKLARSSSLEEKDYKRMCRKIAEDMIALAVEKREVSGETGPNPPSPNSTRLYSPSRCRGRCSRHNPRCSFDDRDIFVWRVYRIHAQPPRQRKQT